MGHEIVKYIADKLGVKIGEEFKIMDVSSGLVRNLRYMFNDQRLVYRTNGMWERSDMLEKLVYGEYKIIKMPTTKQRYYRYGNEYYSFDSLGNIKLFVWEYTPLNNEHKRAGLCFETHQEALEAQARMQ